MEQEKQELVKSDLEDNFILSKAKESNDEVLDQIFGLTLITPSDLKKFQDSKEFLLSTYTDVPQYRPLIVKLISVLNDGQFPTPDSKYWQCKSEAEVHYNEFNRELIKYKKALVDIAEIEYKINKFKTDNHPGEIDQNLVMFDIKRLEIKKEQYMFELKQIEKNLKYRMEELTDWAVISRQLEDKCEFSTKVYSEHYAKSFIKSLEIKINKTENELEKRKLTDQLNTFKRMLIEKIKDTNN
jgi:hypothetical protein